MPASKEIRVSSSAVPGLDWSQVAETVRMRYLAVAQIAMAMHEGEDSVAARTRSFIGMVTNVDEIAQAAVGLGEKSEETAKSGILARCAEEQGGFQQSIVAIQFYDRLSQRLDHVRFALDSLSDLVADKARRFDPGQWELLQKNIRSRYTMQEEQEVFEAPEIVRNRLNQGDIDDIQLF